MWLLDKIIKRKTEKKSEDLICQYCKKPIKYPAYVIVQGTVIKTVSVPKVFTCPEQAFNYAQGIIVHDYCWIKMLKEYGSPVYDMDKVVKEYNKKFNKRKKE